MNIIKLILAAIGLIFVGMALLWVLGFLSSIIWYIFWIGAIGALAFGGYKVFRKIEDKALGADPQTGIGSGTEINMSWDDYERKSLEIRAHTFSDLLDSDMRSCLYAEVGKLAEHRT